LLLGASSLVLASGCHTLRGCSNPEDYADAQNLPRLQVPVGLDGPDTSQVLEIPAQPLEVPREPGNSCLEEPPRMLEPGSISQPEAGSPAQSTEESAPSKRRNRPISPPR
jgi:uncharacterized lipoprotein